MNNVIMIFLFFIIQIKQTQEFPNCFILIYFNFFIMEPYYIFEFEFGENDKKLSSVDYLIT